MVVDDRGYEVVTEAQNWPKIEVHGQGLHLAEAGDPGAVIVSVEARDRGSSRAEKVSFVDVVEGQAVDLVAVDQDTISAPSEPSPIVIGHPG